MTQRFKFTNTNIKNLPTLSKRTYFYDTVEPKLSIQITPNGADAFVVKRALGRKSLQSTQIYVNLGVEHLRDKLNDTVDKMIQISKK